MVKRFESCEQSQFIIGLDMQLLQMYRTTNGQMYPAETHPQKLFACHHAWLENLIDTDSQYGELTQAQYELLRSKASAKLT